MTIEELIQELETMRDMYGPHIEVFKRQIKVDDGSIQLVPIKNVKDDDNDPDPSNWKVIL